MNLLMLRHRFKKNNNEQFNQSLWERIYILMLRIQVRQELYLNTNDNIDDYEYESINSNLN